MEKGIIGFSILALFVVLLAIFNPVTMVDVGQRGIKSTWGKVSPESFTEGIHLIVPIAQKMAVMDVRTQKSNIETMLYTKDIQQAKVDYTVTYNLMPESVHTVYKEVGTNYFDTIVMPTVQGTLKNVFGKWDAQDLIANRQKATADVLAQLHTNLADNHINVTDFQIIDVDYSDTFENSIEAKVVAQQDALKAKNVTVQIQEEAKQKIISAEAEARAMKIKTTALAQSKSLVQYEAVQKWDGKMPQYMMGNTVPFINLSN